MVLINGLDKKKRILGKKTTVHQAIYRQIPARILHNITVKGPEMKRGSFDIIIWLIGLVFFELRWKN